MKKTIYECDRCGAEIADVAYTLTCYAEDVTPGFPGFVSKKVATQNANQNFASAFGVERCLCGKCKDEITDGIFVV